MLLKIHTFHTNIHMVAHADGSVLCTTLNLGLIRKLNNFPFNHVLTAGEYLSSCSQGWAGALFCFHSDTSCGEWKILKMN